MNGIIFRPSGEIHGLRLLDDVTLSRPGRNVVCELAQPLDEADAARNAKRRHAGVDNEHCHASGEADDHAFRGVHTTVASGRALRIASWVSLETSLMMNLLRIGVHCAAALAVVVSSSGCSSSTSGGSKNGTGPVDSGTGSPDASKTVTLDAHVLDFPNTQTALADVKVCIYPALTECATSDQTGHVTLAVPANSEVAISFDATSAGHTRLLAPLTTHASDITGRAWSITSAATAQSIAQAAGFTIDPAKGSIIGQASAPSAGLGGSTGATAGVALALTPASGKGPIYFGASGTPDPTLTATSAAGFGLGIFGGVAPGDYELGFSGKTCVVSDVAAWKGTSPSSVHAPVAAGYLTLAGMDCQ